MRREMIEEKKERQKKRKSETLKIMKRQSAEEDNDTLGTSIYPNNLCPEANSRKMALAFMMRQRYHSTLNG